MYLSKLCEEFIREKRNFNAGGHQKKYMFNVTMPFTDVEGLRFVALTNSPYDFLNYVPTLDHVFLDEPTLAAFERYVDLMFPVDDDKTDMCYFKLLKTLIPDQFATLHERVKKGRYMHSSPNETYKIPICLIPVLELHGIEYFSRCFTVKSTCLSLERTQIRLRLNSFFRAVMTLLGCRESDLIEILVRKGVLPNTNFQLISTQKELTIGLKIAKSCGGIYEALKPAIELAEQRASINALRPKYGYPHSNLCQALEFLFATHPLYRQHINSLSVKTELIDGGKGRLWNAIPNRKRKRVENAKDQTGLPKKMLIRTGGQEWSIKPPCQTVKPDVLPRQTTQEVLSMPLDFSNVVVKQEVVEPTNIPLTVYSDAVEYSDVGVKQEPVDVPAPVYSEPSPASDSLPPENPLKVYFITKSSTDEDIVSQAVRTCIPNIYVPPGFCTIAVQKDFLENGLVLYVPSEFAL
jgi:hypothetical protein